MGFKKSGSALCLPALSVALVIVAGAASVEAREILPDGFFTRPAVVKLGKALFWDMQAGSGNGSQSACATCHYQAGTDSEPRRVASGQRPDGIIGSLGVRHAEFYGIQLNEYGEALPEDDYGEMGHYTITGRQAPPAVESEFVHLFWDGRANNCFNGVDPGGEKGYRGLYARSGGGVVPTSIEICDAAQASQSVGPANSSAEMAAAGRSFPELGYKLLRVKPLALQAGDIAEELSDKAVGHYASMIEDAFGRILPDFIGDEPVEDASRLRVMDHYGQPHEIVPSLTEQNFSLFWGLAIMAYELSLDTSLHVQGPTPAQRRSFKRMRCDGCHFEDGHSAAHVFTGKNGKAFTSIGVADASVDPGVVDDFVGEKEGVGNFKTSHLFNLPLTAPYFHDGSAADLGEMLDFYIRGGNDVEQEVKIKDLSRRIKARGGRRGGKGHNRGRDRGNESDVENVIQMLEGLTDERIAQGTGPYGHPSLELALADGSTFWLRASDDPEAQADMQPGLSYGPTEYP